MKTAMAILLAFVAGSANAQPLDAIMDDDSATDATTMYEVDENRDGRTDRLLILEQSDSLA